MIISEPVLPHCSEFKENIHYVSTTIRDLPKTILYYLEHDQHGQRIAENAYRLMTTELQFSRILKGMFEAAAFYRQSHIGGGPD